MSGAIIVQPDGRLALWSSIVDALTVWDATDEELVEHLAQQAAERERESVRRAIDRVRGGSGPRGAPTWERAVTETISRFGDDPLTAERFGDGS